MFTHYRGKGSFERCLSQAGTLWKLVVCLVLADCSPFPFTCTRASSCKQTWSQKDPKLESLVLRRNCLPFVLELIKISHYFYLLRQYFMQSHFLVRKVQGNSALKCHLSWGETSALYETPLKPFPGSGNGTVWWQMSWHILLLSPNTESCPGQIRKSQSALSSAKLKLGTVTGVTHVLPWINFLWAMSVVCTGNTLSLLGNQLLGKFVLA